MLNTLFFCVTYHPRDISRLTIPKLYEEYYEKLFEDKLKIWKFIVYYHQDKNLKEYVLPSTYKLSSPNDSIAEYFKSFNPDG